MNLLLGAFLVCALVGFLLMVGWLVSLFIEEVDPDA